VAIDLDDLISSIKPYLNEIKKTNFRLTADLEKKVLSRAGEEI
jgi:hypothetical protein